MLQPCGQARFLGISMHHFWWLDPIQIQSFDGEHGELLGGKDRGRRLERPGRQFRELMVAESHGNLLGTMFQHHLQLVWNSHSFCLCRGDTNYGDEKKLYDWYEGAGKSWKTCWCALRGDRTFFNMGILSNRIWWLPWDCSGICITNNRIL